MQSFPLKKAEFEGALKSVKSNNLRSYYDDCLKRTESCFETYTSFYNALKSVIDLQIEIDTCFDNESKKHLTDVVDGYEKGKELYEKRLSENSVFDSLLNTNELLLKSLEANAKLAGTIKKQRDVARNISNDKSKILSALLESTFDVLFLYIYRMDRANVNQSTIKEFIAFAAGIIPVVGPIASGLVAIVNIVKQRTYSSSSADDTMHYLESYLQASDVWEQITNGYIEMLEAWKEELDASS